MKELLGKVSDFISDISYGTVAMQLYLTLAASFTMVGFQGIISGMESGFTKTCVSVGLFCIILLMSYVTVATYWVFYEISMCGSMENTNLVLIALGLLITIVGCGMNYPYVIWSVAITELNWILSYRDINMLKLMGW